MVSLHSNKFGGQRDCGERDIVVFVYHVTLQKHLIKA